jgi:hypothetical protein
MQRVIISRDQAIVDLSAIGAKRAYYNASRVAAYRAGAAERIAAAEAKRARKAGKRAAKG